MKTSERISLGFKGFFMGAANVIPGVSGGTIALISGIYGRLIDALAAIMSIPVWKHFFKGEFKEFWRKIDGTFLVWIFIGVGISIFSLAKLATFCLDNHPVQTWAFFFGLIAASAVVMLKDVKGWTWKDVAFTLAGIALGLVICTLSPTETPDTYPFIFLCGALAICTMILPGISGSFILVILGKYKYIMDAVGTLNLPVLAVFAVGCALGLLAFAKFLHWLMAGYERQTMLVLVGFVLGSLVMVWPWNNVDRVPGGSMHITGAIVWSLVGIVLIALIEWVNARKKAATTEC